MHIGVRRILIQDQRGGVAVEFVALLPAFLFLTFFAFEISIAVLWVGTVEKAAQLGARLAIVSDYAVSGLAASQKNLSSDTSLYPPGTHCSAGGGNACAPFNNGNPLTCTGAACVGAFNAIFTRMDNIANLLQPANVTITYEYVGLGFAGGPIIPRVTVTIQNVPYDTFTTTILAGFMRLATGNQAATSPLTTLPTITATFTGEDLNSAGAS